MALAGLPLVLALALDAAIGLFRRPGELPTQGSPIPAWLLGACLVYVGITLGYGTFGMKMLTSCRCSRATRHSITGRAITRPH